MSPSTNRLQSLHVESKSLGQLIEQKEASPEQICRYKATRNEILSLFASVHGLSLLEWVGARVDDMLAGELTHTEYETAYIAAWGAVELAA